MRIGWLFGAPRRSMGGAADDQSERKVCMISMTEPRMTHLVESLYCEYQRRVEVGELSDNPRDALMFADQCPEISEALYMRIAYGQIWDNVSDQIDPNGIMSKEDVEDEVYFKLFGKNRVRGRDLAYVDFMKSYSRRS